MTIELFLSLLNFALAVGALIPIFFLGDNQKRIVAAVIISMLIPTTGIVWYRLRQHEAIVVQLEKEIENKLSNNIWTFDQIYNELHYDSYSLVNEALFRSVRNHRVDHKIIPFQKDGTILQVKGYFRKPTEKNQ